MSTTLPEVEVRHAGGDEYQVTIRHGAESSQHVVRVSERCRQNYGGDALPDRLVAESFRWLLEQAPDSKLTARFDLPALADVHPEYPRAIWQRLH